MSANIEQIYVANPVTTINNNDLLYIGQAAIADAAITGANLKALFAPAAGSSSIITVGTITSGTWQGTIIAPTYGGTGINNGSNTITIGGNLQFSGAHTFTGTLTADTTVTFPASGTLTAQVQVQQNLFNVGVSAGATDAYTVTLSPVPASYTDGMTVILMASRTNTTVAPTLNVNGLGAIPIVTSAGFPLIGDILLNSIYELVYNVTNNQFTLLNPSVSLASAVHLQSNFYNTAIDTGAANAYVAIVAPNISTIPTTGAVYWVNIANNNTGASTLNLNSSGVKSIVNLQNTALTGGELLAGNWAQFIYDGVNYQLINSSSAGSIPVPVPVTDGGTGLVTAGAPARYVVSTVTGQGGFTTIQAAITQAVSDGASSSIPAVIWIWPGSYTENLTLAAYVSLVGVADSNASGVVVNGSAVYSDTGNIVIENIGFVSTSASPAISFQSVGSAAVDLNNVSINALNGSGLECTSTSTNINYINGYIVAPNTGYCFDIQGGNHFVDSVNSSFNNNASALSAGIISFVNCSLSDAFVLTGSGNLAIYSSNIKSSTVNCFDIGASNAVLISNSYISCSSVDNFFATGTGSLIYGNISNSGSANLINPTLTLTPLVEQHGSLIVNNNISFDGGATTLSANGQIWIGATSGTPVPATLTAGTGVTITNGANSITIAAPGITTPVSPANGGTGLSTSGGPAVYVVSSVSGQGGFTSVQAAINQAVTDGASDANPVAIWIFDGNYTENITLAPGVNLCGAGDPSTPGVNIIGNAVYTATGTVSITNVGFTSANTAAALSFQSAGTAAVHLQSVALNAGGGIGLECTSATTTVEVSIGSITAGAGGRCKNITAGFVEFFAGISTYTDTASTISGGEVRIVSSDLKDAFVVTGGQLELYQVIVLSSPTTALSSINVGTGANAVVINAILGSSAVSGFAVSGTGNLLYSELILIDTAIQFDPGLTIQGLPTYTGQLNVNNNISFDNGATTLSSDGQVWIGSSTGIPVPSTLTAGTGVSITNAANSITISATGSGLTWNGIAGTTQLASANNGYIVQNAAQTTITLPATFAIGDTIIIKGLGAAGWILKANTGQIIQVGQSATSSAGTVTSAANFDVIQVSGLVANTTWSMDYSVSTGFTIA